MEYYFEEIWNYDFVKLDLEKFLDDDICGDVLCNFINLFKVDMNMYYFFLILDYVILVVDFYLFIFFV